MRLTNAIDYADRMRPNTVPRPEKAQCLYKLEMEIAEIMETEKPDWSRAKAEDPELLLPEPWAGLYPQYLAAFIDYYQEEIDLYQVDSIMANQSLMEWKSAYRREHRSETDTRFRGVWV